MAELGLQVSSTRGLWQRRAWVAVFTGSTISIVGDGLYAIALPWWVLQATGSTTAMAAVSAAETLIQVVSAPLMGTLADRLNRRWAMLAMDLARAALVAIAVLLIAGRQSGLVPVLAVAAALSLCTTLFGPALGASMIDIAGREHLLQANAARTTVQQLGQAAALGVGGMLVGLIGAGGALVADAFSFVASAVAILAAGPFDQTHRPRQGSFWQDLGQGLVYVRRSPIILGILGMGVFFNMSAVPLLVYLAPLARLLGAGAHGYGWLMGALVLGGALGATLLQPVAKVWPWRKGLLGIAGMLLVGAAMIALGAAGTLPLALACTALGGVFIAWPGVLVATSMQAMIPRELQGRVGGLMNTVLNALTPLGYIAGGVLADRFPIGPLISVSGALMLLIGLVTFVIPGLRDVP